MAASPIGWHNSRSASRVVFEVRVHSQCHLFMLFMHRSLDLPKVKALKAHPCTQLSLTSIRFWTEAPSGNGCEIQHLAEVCGYRITYSVG